MKFYKKLFFTHFIVSCLIHFGFSQTNSDSLRITFVNHAMSYIGTPYMWGGEDVSGMDCSGLIYASAQGALGIETSRTVKTLFNSMQLVPLSEKQVGDILFFDTSWFSTASHVGIYVGDNTFLHAPSSGSERFVKISSLNEPYWNKRCIGAGVFTSLTGTVDIQNHSEVYKTNESNSADTTHTVSNVFTKITSVLVNTWYSVKTVLNQEIVLPFGDIFQVQSMPLYKLLVIGVMGIFILRKITRLLGFRGLLVVLIIGAVIADVFLFEKQLFVERVLSWGIWERIKQLIK